MMTQIYVALSRYQATKSKLIELKVWPSFCRKQLQIEFLNANCSISIAKSMQFVSPGQIINIAALVEIMAWIGTGDNPSRKLMIASLDNPYMGRSDSMV